MFLRIGRSSRAVLLSRCSATSGLCVPKATRNVNLTAPKRRELSYHPNEVFLFRTCSTSQAKLNCWNCKQLLDNVPAFFCNSCKVIQPPEEGASYFKILDWWVSLWSSWTSTNWFLHFTLCCLPAVTTLSRWIHRSCRKDTWSCSGPSTQTTTARDQW